MRRCLSLDSPSFWRHAELATHLAWSVSAAGPQMQFTLDPRNLSIVDLAGDRRVSAGTYSLSVGGGQSGTVAPRAETEFRIKGDQKLPE